MVSPSSDILLAPPPYAATTTEETLTSVIMENPWDVISSKAAAAAGTDAASNSWAQINLRSTCPDGGAGGSRSLGYVQRNAFEKHAYKFFRSREGDAEYIGPGDGETEVDNDEDEEEDGDDFYDDSNEELAAAMDSEAVEAFFTELFNTKVELREFYMKYWGKKGASFLCLCCGNRFPGNVYKQHLRLVTRLRLTEHRALLAVASRLVGDGDEKVNVDKELLKFSKLEIAGEMEEGGNKGRKE